MKPAKIPEDEKLRLESLKELQILDTQAEKCFDDLTQLAAQICETPICLISLVDEDRQWFKSKHGLDANETPRDFAFCAHAILDDHIFEVENSDEDERFADNPLVTGEPRVKFYAGAPIKTSDNFNVGTLCVIDNSPKKLNDFQKNALETLANQVSVLMEYRKNILNVAHAYGQLSALSVIKSADHEINNPVAIATLLLNSIKDEVPKEKKDKIVDALMRISGALNKIKCGLDSAGRSKIGNE